MTTQMEVMPQTPQQTQQKYQKPSVGATIGGALAGLAVNSVATTPVKVISPKLMANMENLSNSLSADEFVQVKNVIEDSVKTTGLADKGVEILRAGSDNAEVIKNIMAKELNKGVAKFLPAPIKDALAVSSAEQVEWGKNAFYAMESKKIVLPEKALSLAGFHEMGHALNANKSVFGKMLQKCRGLGALAFPIALISLIKTKKAPGEKPEGKLDKVTTFIKNNAGKLTFAAFLPMLLEEGLATIKGNKIAKNTLSKELARKVAKSNALGFSTYLALAALSSVGIWVANKIKDKIAQPKPIQNTVS